MINKVKTNFSTGLMRIKWIAAFVAERTKAETSVAKLLYESHKLEDRIDDLYRDIGRRVIELKDKGEKEVFGDFVIQQAISEIKNLKESIQEYKSEAKKLHKISD